MTRWLGLCVLLFCTHVCAQGQLQFSAPWGPHAIGFKVVHLLDSSRSWGNGYDPLSGLPVATMPERPLQVLVWYPASAPGKPMAYTDYLGLVASEDAAVTDPAVTQRAIDEQIRAWAGADPVSDYQAIARQSVHATAGAGAAKGPFPLIVYAPSDSNPSIEDDVLCEYLASHGYVVVSTSSRGAHLPYMTNGQMAMDLANTRAQAADIGVLIGQASRLGNVNTNAVAVLGYSWGGMASKFAAATDDRIKLLVDFDGSVRYFPKLLAMAPDISPDRIHVPLLFFADQEDPLTPAKDNKPGSFIDRIRHADVTTIWLRDMQHDDLTSDSLRFGNDRPHGPASAKLRSESYSWLARYTLAFLDAHLKNDSDATSFLSAKPETQGVPAGMLVMTHRASQGPAPSLQDFAQRLGQSGFEHSAAVYTAYHRDHPDFSLTPDQIEPWLYALIQRQDLQRALGLAQLETFLAPQRSDGWLDLAHVDNMLDEPAQALQAFKQALRVDPRNTYARKQVERLSKTGSVAQATAIK
ncbi:dienelactone hydrolase family protein [Dyella sp. C11]|uniref:dienelactone hydrolase family protein n=1 Tax=Dyella sp. C11 TaxID=2126991 RepID=UPI000D65392F|nr:dienelactone hydrolase family protein [Dyella sp. C11]